MEFKVEYKPGLYESGKLFLNGEECETLKTTLRITGRSGKFVVKYDNHSENDDETYKQTQREIGLYQTLSDKDKELLPKVHAWGSTDIDGTSHAWIVEEWMELEKWSGNWNEPKPPEVVEFADKHHMWDIGTHNFGMRNNKPVIYDFAL